MATDARLHSAFGATEKPSMAGFNALSLSINDVMPVSNATSQASRAAALVAAGVNLATNPVVTARTNAPGLHRIEYSYDGSVFLPASGVLHFTSTSTRDTWTTANSAYLVVGDVCNVAGVTYTWNGTGWVRIGALCMLTSSTGLINGTATMSWSEVADTANFFTSGTPTVITIPFAGNYLVAYTVRSNGIAPITANVQVNGSPDAYLPASSAGASGAAADAARTSGRVFAAGDTVTVNAVSTASASGAHSLAMVYLGFN